MGLMTALVCGLIFESSVLGSRFNQIPPGTLEEEQIKRAESPAE